MKKVKIFSLIIATTFFLSGCAATTTTPTQRGAGTGALAGAAAGQIIGKNTKGTMIGAGVGAIGGALLNDARYNRY